MGLFAIRLKITTLWDEHISSQKLMPDNIILFLFLGLIFGVIGWILFTMLAKHLKGSVTINIPKRAYKFGETITGKCLLHAKKEITCESITAHLVAYKRVTTYWKDGKRHTRKDVFTRFSQSLEWSVMLISWERKTYDIEIHIPSHDDVFWEKKDIDFWDGTLWKLASYALNNTKRNQLSWQLKVDMESQGLDIHGKKDIFVTQ